MDLGRAAVHFVKWWREEGGLISASSGLRMNAAGNGSSYTQGWGFDFQWDARLLEGARGMERERIVRVKMEECIDKYLEDAEREEREENNVSATQKKKLLSQEEKAKRKLKHLKR